MIKKIDPAFLRFQPIDQLANNSMPDKILTTDVVGNLSVTNYSELKSFVVSGVKGEATPTSSPTPWASGQPDLYEKYDIKTAGTYTNFKNGATPPLPIVVTAEDLADNFVQIWVKNGVSQKALSPKKDIKLDEAGGALSYVAALNLLGGFMNQDTSVIENITTIKDSSAMYGGYFLYKNNTYMTNPTYPGLGIVYDFPVGKATKFRVNNITNIQPGSAYAPVTGKKKNGQGEPILLWTDPNVTGLHTLDVSDYETVSVQIVNNAAFPILELIEYQTPFKDVKEYMDENLIVADYFLNPQEVVWQELSMPQPNEINDAMINKNWQQFAVPGMANGKIIISNIPADFDLLEVDGNFGVAGNGALWLGGYNDSTNVHDNLLEGVAGSGKKVFKIDRQKYQGYVYSRVNNNQKYRIGKTVQLQREKDSIKKYIDNHISSGSAISSEKTAQIKRPSKVLRLEFTTNDALPVDKSTIASGEVLITDMEGLGIKKFATIEVQGASSAVYPKKNWTFALYNNVEKTDSFKLRIGNWCEHSEFVYKANWIDATHARNLISNHIWEDIVQSRKYYPKRENEKAYVVGDTAQLGRFDSGALTHVDGVPCELYINGGFYGIGSFNLGKKRENYDLSKANQNHIQLAAETHANFYSYVETDWEIRNPGTPDANFLGKINAWFADNALTGTAFKTAFETHHDLKNAIDFFLLAEFIQSPDMYTKNLMLTSWDGVKFYFLPYDMDTTFGLKFDGQELQGWTFSIRSANFWNKFYAAFTVEIKARYAELKAAGVFTFNNFYKHADRINKTYGVGLFKKEQAAWAAIPSNSIVYTSYPQLYDWMKNRLIWLDSQYA